MVQYVFTPWRDRKELLLVRQQFFGPSTTSSTAPGLGVVTHSSAPVSGQPRRLLRSSDTSRRTTVVGGSHDGNGDADGAGPEPRRQQRHTAVARVSMWMQRGNCPHMVESTALLTAALLSDDEASKAENAASSTYAVRAAYSAAFSRFVTGLLDSHQDKQRKQSMYSVAKTIGLPATFVELRHQSTHEQLPSRAKLRSTAVKALDWIWDYYWKHLTEDAGAASRDEAATCEEAILRYLREEDDEPRRRTIMNLLRQWDTDSVLKSIAEIQRTHPGNQVYLKCLRLKTELTAGEVPQKKEAAAGVASVKRATQHTESSHEEPDEEEEEEEEEVAAPADKPRESTDRKPGPEPEAELDTGWSRYKGTWKSKPIGVV